MPSFLIVYGTGEGQTAKVARQLGETLSELGHAVRIEDIDEIDADVGLGDHDALLIGSSIHAGRHHGKVIDFIEMHVDELATMPNGFFQVSLSSAGDDVARATAAGYIDSLIERTKWTPDRIGQFGGALRYSEYGFLKRAMMRRLGGRSLDATDTTRDYEYTDWDEVRTFAEDFASFVTQRVS